MTPDLTGSRERSPATELLDACNEAARSANGHNLVSTPFDAAAEAARSVAAPRASGAPVPRLAGSVKDLFDERGDVTAAGSTVPATSQPAASDCPAVARLRAAGTAFIGRTNLSEFAFSAAGINPHFGTPADPVAAMLDAEPRILGGATSGGAVSIATGAAWAALGYDTGGSTRIPSALRVLSSFKNTGAVRDDNVLDVALAIEAAAKANFADAA